MPSVTIQADADDAYIIYGVGTVAGNTTVATGYYLVVNDAVLRFAAVGIAQGTELASATLTIVPTETLGTTGDYLVYAYDADDATMPADQTDHEGRSLTTAMGGWNPGTTTAGVAINFDVTAIVQEVVDRAGFSASSAIVLTLKGAVDVPLLRFAAREHATYDAAILAWTIAGATSGGIGSANFNRFLCPGAR